MRKVLLSSAAICGLALAATPALADDGGVKLDVGGYFTGYGVFLNQDEGDGYTGTEEAREFDFMRNTEVHLSGETTLDNGLTVGVHLETEADGANAFEVEESYMYMSGTWGRVNFGEEDGAAYLLQVAAPAADENVDGIGQQLQPVDYTLMFASGASTYTATGMDALVLEDFDYGQNITSTATKFTYLTPVLNGFQAGVSYTADTETSSLDTNNLNGVSYDNEDEAYGEAYEVGLRYEGQYNELGFAIGAGYSHIELENDADNATADTTLFGTAVDLDDRDAWNVGVDFDYGPFGMGVVYAEDNLGAEDTDEEIWAVGVDYTTGAFRLGASWLTQDNELGTDAGEVDTDRYTGGVVYTYGPGMSFRGSISYIDHDLPDTSSYEDADATSIMLGTQVNF